MASIWSRASVSRGGEQEVQMPPRLDKVSKRTVARPQEKQTLKEKPVGIMRKWFNKILLNLISSM